MSTMELAEGIARVAHAGQMYDGKDYVDTHVADVVGRIMGDFRANPYHVQAAWLNDVLEDNPIWTLEDLGEAGFQAPVIIAIVRLTKLPGQSNEDYLAEVARNKIATLVKYHDSSANFEYGGLQKYADNLAFLQPYVDAL